MKNKILITGGTGFIGANLVYKFLELNEEVHLIVRKSSNFWRLEPVIKKLHLHYIDLLESSQVIKLLKLIKPEIILHLAAYGCYPRRQKDEEEMVRTNILATFNLINSAAKVGFKCFINTGSGFEYGFKNKPIKESDLIEPTDFYGVTKVFGSLYTQYLGKQHNLPIITIRPFAVYGYFEDKERLIPTVIKSFLINEPLQLSNPNYVRDFIFIEDLVDAYLKAIKKINNIKGEIFNIGSGKEVKIKEIIETMRKITHISIRIKYNQIKSRIKEPFHWRADISKAKRLLNWKPKYNLEEGLKKDIEWFKKFIKFYL